MNQTPQVTEWLQLRPAQPPELFNPILHESETFTTSDNSTTCKYRGTRHGMLTALEYSHMEKYQKFWIYRCDCGNKKAINRYKVDAGQTRSCGCQRGKWERK